MTLCFGALGNKLERQAVVAPTFAGRRRTVVENVAMMTAAADAMIFDARQNQFEIRAGFERRGNAREETRPAGAAVVFHLRRENRQAATSADENARLFFIVERTGARRFGALVAQD